MADAVIRRATVEDAPGLQACMVAAYAGYTERMGETTLPPLELDYAEEIADYPTWVATLKGDIVGGLTMMFTSDHATIANIAVSPASQGHGLGRTLMSFAEAQARDRGLDEIRLATHVLLTENVSLYIHLGWSEYARDENRVYMRKNIG